MPVTTTTSSVAEQSDVITLAEIDSYIQSGDIDGLMQRVQGDRTKMLDTQLRQQISEIQNRNKLMAKLNNVSSSLNALLNLYPGGEKDNNAKMKDAKIPNWNKTGTDDDKRYTQMRDNLYSAMKVKDEGMEPNAPDGSYTLQINGGISDLTKGSLSTALQVVKNQVDALSNTQQTDMLRLKSLTNKRNEAFDTMTGSLKKSSDSKSNIISHP